MVTTRQRRIILPLGDESGDSYGYDYDFPEIELPEIVVTPDGIGIFAAYGSFACPAVGLTLSGISLVCTLVGNYMNSRDESSY